MFKQVALATTAAVLMVWGAASGEGAPQFIPDADGSWSFAVSGDSRNCGDVVMPAIAMGAKQHNARFYWHLGDFRAIYRVDEDYAQEQAPDLQKASPYKPESLLVTGLNMSAYLNPEPRAGSSTDSAWQDFEHNQLASFGDLPVFLGIGNHETIAPMTHAAYYKEFARWLSRPEIVKESGPQRAWNHWILNGIDFINMDNADESGDRQFDDEQVGWVKGVLAADEKNEQVKSIVVGMHKALPDSISFGHSMNETKEGTQSGRAVYRLLLDARDKHGKNVYVLASHSHFYMEDIYNTVCWRNHGGVLPGWIVGTAGAQRYRLPVDISGARMAVTDVYGYLQGTVHPDGNIDFRFQQVDENSVPADVVRRFTPSFVHWCYSDNREMSVRKDAPLDCNYGTPASGQ
jgi:hypothetical protein